MKEQIKKNLDESLKRKGFDELNRFLLIMILILLLIDAFFKIFIIGILEIVAVLVFFFRLLSKNKYKRVKENRIFLEIYVKIKEPFKHLKKISVRNKKYKSDKKNIYRKCPKCGLILKLPYPKKIGIKHTTCPDCGKRFGFLTLKKRRS